MDLPRRGVGRQTAEKQAQYESEVATFCDSLIQMDSSLDFKMSSRGWCYHLENEGWLTKGEFSSAETLINDCRKNGMLPMDICSEDNKRDSEGIQGLDEPIVSDFAGSWVYTIKNAFRRYTPFSFWDDKDVYIEMVVEKIDLKSLFRPICDEFYVPIANQAGWPDLWMRYSMAQRFKEHEDAGRQCVLLYCGDFDPGGLSISNSIRSNLEDMTAATGWSPSHLEIDRFGLNYDFIMENNLTWIDNLETGSGRRLDDPKHRMHNAPHVQDYLSKYGARKVEANALVARVPQARQMARDAIVKWIGDEDAPRRYTEALHPYRQDAKTEIAQMLAAI